MQQEIEYHTLKLLTRSQHVIAIVIVVIIIISPQQIVRFHFIYNFVRAK